VIVLIDIFTVVVLMDVTDDFFLNLIEAYPAVCLFSSIRGSLYYSASSYSLPAVDTFTAPVSGRISWNISRK
jgi:hypothetical protein